MKITCLGGGPASLYFSILAKKAHPDWDIRVFERNPPNMTWGFGVVFSDETMEGFREDDEETYRAITDSFVHWDDIEVFFKGHHVRSTGHGFAGMQRLRLLQIMEERAKTLGVVVEHNSEQRDVEALRADCDLLVAGDGINSIVRTAHEAEFGTDLAWRPNKFVWLGTTKAFDTFTFYFNKNEHGLWRAHCYQYMPGIATFIVETTEDAWRAAGLENATEEETIAYCSKVFAEELGPDRLISNNSVWRTFPRVRNKRYFHDNMVLVGDALHTAHFSIGSGTKLAMEDGVALIAALNAHPGDIPAALAAFQAEREPVVNSLQRAAQVSMEWFEETERYYDALAPEQFAHSLLTRSMRITHDNLKVRDPGYVAAFEAWYSATAHGEAGRPVPEVAPPPLFTPYRLRDLVLENRTVVSPMCMYSAVDGVVNDWHLVHLGSRAVGGAGLIFTEMTAISPDARISPQDAGIWSPEQVAAWKRITDFVHTHSKGKMCLQLGHAGRKGSTYAPWEGPGADHALDEDNWEVLAPSAIAYADYARMPREMGREDMDMILDDYAAATRNAIDAGFDMIEVHMAHGYLLSTFLSPLTNQRSDEYGGSIDNRMRFPLEVFEAVRAIWPQDKPISVRISASDWLDGGFSHDDGVALAKALKAAGCDILDVSAGQVVKEQKPVYGRLFQTPFSARLRLDAGMPTITVGNVQSFADANTILAAGRADLCALARMHLADPYWTLHAAYEYGQPAPVPPQYASVRRYTPRWV